MSTTSMEPLPTTKQPLTTVQHNPLGMIWSMYGPGFYLGWLCILISQPVARRLTRGRPEDGNLTRSWAASLIYPAVAAIHLIYLARHFTISYGSGAFVKDEALGFARANAIKAAWSVVFSYIILMPFSSYWIPLDLLVLAQRMIVEICVELLCLGAYAYRFYMLSSKQLRTPEDKAHGPKNWPQLIIAIVGMLAMFASSWASRFEHRGGWWKRVFVISTPVFVVTLPWNYDRFLPYSDHTLYQPEQLGALGIGLAVLIVNSRGAYDCVMRWWKPKDLEEGEKSGDKTIETVPLLDVKARCETCQGTASEKA